MSYRKLKYFIQNKMRMSQVYQPVMLISLLKNEGKCTQTDIAKDLLAYDQSQIEYYAKTTNNMVGKVLISHKLVEKQKVEKQKKEYSLNGFSCLSSAEIKSLIKLCEEKLNDFIEKRGQKIWSHRKKSAGYISGSLRYEVLKRARFRCELCGISAEEKALEVDHIIPRNRGGSDDISNLQALCYSCNAMKRDRDDTDFRQIREAYKKREDGCLFCGIDSKRIIMENNLAYSVRDGFPVTEFHSLIIPKRHAASYFELGQAEINACTQLINNIQKAIKTNDSLVDGFNIGINNGESAGQTIFHCHIHLIPRRKGDTANPRGGVRGVIPSKMNYK